jgi:hypothetical protein
LRATNDAVFGEKQSENAPECATKWGITSVSLVAWKMAPKTAERLEAPDRQRWNSAYTQSPARQRVDAGQPPHGASVPATATYGLREVHDVHRWIDWLSGQSGCGRIYGMGISMGGAILLQSLAVEKRFSAVAADAPFGVFVHRRVSGKSANSVSAAAANLIRAR